MKKNIIALMITAFLAAGLTGCAKKEETPAERAAKQFNKTMKTVGEEVEKAGKQVEKAARDAARESKK